jgi:D-alanyl-D-alanine carboxypeptidase (penicillin-binding protein 5/6)
MILPAGRSGLIALLAAGLATAVGTWNYVQPLPAVAATSSGLPQYVITGTAPTMPWPSVGSGAVGASGLGLIARSADVAPAPIASVAKVMTALVLLADRPLAAGQSGPILTITEQDVATYTSDAADGQSVVRVVAGEQLNEFQALEALLIPSGNNIAETLARWDAGSVGAFVARMNQRAAALHLGRTVFADPAGVSLQTVSTPTDLLALGLAAMHEEVLAQIVDLPQTTLPVAGVMYNVNSALGQSGIIGIKTGSGLNVGANFLFAATADVDGHQLTLVGCVMGIPTLEAAFNNAEALIGAARQGLRMRPLVSRSDVVGTYNTAWGSRSDLVATADLTLVEWPGMILRESLETKTLDVDRPIASGTPVGTLHLVLGDQRADVPLVTATSLDPPGVTWRAFRINL